MTLLTSEGIQDSSSSGFKPILKNWPRIATTDWSIEDLAQAIEDITTTNDKDRAIFMVCMQARSLLWKFGINEWNNPEQVQSGAALLRQAANSIHPHEATEREKAESTRLEILGLAAKLQQTYDKFLLQQPAA